MEQMRAPPSHQANQIPVHPSLLEQHIALVVVLWIIVAAVFVVAANAWAMGAL